MPRRNDRRPDRRRPRRGLAFDGRPELEARLLLAASISEFPLRSTGGTTNGVATTPDGNSWVTIGTDHVGRINKTTGNVDLQYPTPTPNSDPTAIVAAPGGDLWFFESALNQFAYLDPTSGTITEVPFLAGVPTPARPIVEGMAVGSDGNLWFTEPGNDRIGRIDLVDQPTTGTFAITEFTVPTDGAQPYGIASSPRDGDLWFAESGANQVASINPTTHLITEYPVSSTASVQPEGITVTADGNVWFTETNADAVGLLDPFAARPSEGAYALSAGSHPTAITVGPNLALWFLEPGLGKIGTIGQSSRQLAEYGFKSTGDVGAIASGFGGKILASNVAGGRFGVFNLSNSTAAAVTVPSLAPGYPYYLTAGPDGNLWYTEGGQIGTFDPSTGFNTELTSATKGTLGDALGITPGPDGLLWFADRGNEIGSIDPTTHQINEYTLASPADHPEQIIYDPSNSGDLWATDPTDDSVIRFNPTNRAATSIKLPTAGSDPEGIALGPDGNLYVTESSGRKIAVIDPLTAKVTAEIPTPGAAGYPQRIVLGSDGRLWFTVGYNDPRIAALTLATGTKAASFATYLIPNHGESGESSGSQEIAAGPDGDIWFSQDFIGGSGNVVDQIDPASGAITEYDSTHGVAGLAAGPDGNLWFAGPGGVPILGVIPLSAASIPTQLAVTTSPPANLTATKGFGLIVAALDAAGSPTRDYSGPVTVQLASNPGNATLSGTTTVDAVNGVATFSGLDLDNAAAGYTITASAGGLAPATSSPFSVTLPATQSAIAASPTTTPEGTEFTVTVDADDPDGNLDTSFNGTIQIALGNNPGGSSSVLGGSLIVGANAGVATFSDLTLNVPGQGYTLLASDAASSLASATTPTFAVTPAPATHLVITAGPSSSVTAGVTFPLALEAENDQGQVDTGYDGSITASLLGTTGATLGGTTTARFSQGVASFNNLSLTRAGQGYTINLAADSLPRATVGPIAVVAGAAKTLGLSSTGGTTLGVGTSTGLVVAILDAFGNMVTTYTETVRLSTSDPAVPNPAPYTFGGADAGVHAFPIRLLTPGARTVSAAASPLSGSLTIQVVKAATGASLTASKASYTLAQPIHLTSRVGRVASGAGTPTGSVTFFDGSTALGSAALDGTGTATLVVAKLGPGTHQLHASYGGDSNDTAIQSASLPVYVGDGLKDDFDGDGKADVSAYGKDPASGKYRFKTLLSSTGFNPNQAVIFDNNGYGFGGPGSIPLPADYFGEGVDAYALWSPNNVGGMTFTAVSPITAGKYVNINFGQATDIPVVADVDGDGKADFGVYGYSKGLGYRFDFLLSSTNFDVTKQDIFNNNGYGFGNAKSIPVVADFDGSGKAGFGLFNPASGAVASSFTYVSANQAVSFTRSIGGPNDAATAADVDGDGKADLVLYGPDPAHAGHYRYLALTSSSGYSPTATTDFDNNGYGYGGSQATMAIADYQGDGKADFAVFVPGGNGAELIYQGGQAGAGVVLDDFAATDLILTSPTYLRARKVRGS